MYRHDRALNIYDTCDTCFTSRDQRIYWLAEQPDKHLIIHLNSHVSNKSSSKPASQSVKLRVKAKSHNYSVNSYPHIGQQSVNHQVSFHTLAQPIACQSTSQQPHCHPARIHLFTQPVSATPPPSTSSEKNMRNKKQTKKQSKNHTK